MNIRPTKYLMSHLLAYMGIYICVIGDSFIFAFVGGIGIGLGLKMAYEAGLEERE